MLSTVMWCPGLALVARDIIHAHGAPVEYSSGDRIRGFRLVKRLPAVLGH